MHIFLLFSNSSYVDEQRLRRFRPAATENTRGKLSPPWPNVECDELGRLLWVAGVTTCIQEKPGTVGYIDSSGHGVSAGLDEVLCLHNSVWSIATVKNLRLQQPAMNRKIYFPSRPPTTIRACLFFERSVHRGSMQHNNRRLPFGSTVA